jgi:hypothetical protein
MLRSVAKRRVSKHVEAASFETRPAGAPQDEGGSGNTKQRLQRLDLHHARHSLDGAGDLR